MMPTMPDEDRDRARQAAAKRVPWLTLYEMQRQEDAADAAAEVAYAAGQRDAARRTGHLCEPCERNDHDACTGDCQGSCCPAYAAGRADERARVVADLRAESEAKTALPRGHRGNEEASYGFALRNAAARYERGEHLGD